MLEPTWLLVPWLKTTAADPVDWGLSADPPPLSQDLESFRQLRHNPSGLLRRSSLPQQPPARLAQHLGQHRRQRRVRHEVAEEVAAVLVAGQPPLSMS